MTIYGEAIGAEGWAKGSKLRITAEPMRQSKTGKFYQTAKSVELVDGAAVVIPTVKPTAVKDVSSQWKEKYRLTMSNLLAASIQSGKEVDFSKVDEYVRKILDAKYDGDEAPF
jgi:pyrroline-5-carboxylate reductase